MNLKPSQIRTQAITHLVSNYTMTPVEYPPSILQGDNNEYVKFEIHFGKGFSVIKGDGTTTRHTGLLFVTVYKKLINSQGNYIGANRTYEITDEVLRVLERQRLNNSDVFTRAGSIQTDQVIERSSGMFHFIVISIPFVVS